MKTFKELLASKKFLVLLSALVVYAASRFGLDVSQAAADRALGLVAAYLIGQGLADLGKEAAKVAATAPTVVTPLVTSAVGRTARTTQPGLLPLQPPPGLP